MLAEMEELGGNVVEALVGKKMSFLSLSRSRSCRAKKFNFDFYFSFGEGQNELISSVHVKVLGIGETLGISRSLMRLIEVRKSRFLSFLFLNFNFLYPFQLATTILR